MSLFSSALVYIPGYFPRLPLCDMKDHDSGSGVRRFSSPSSFMTEMLKKFRSLSFKLFPLCTPLKSPHVPHTLPLLIPLVEELCAASFFYCFPSRAPHYGKAFLNPSEYLAVLSANLFEVFPLSTLFSPPKSLTPPPPQCLACFKPMRWPLDSLSLSSC